MTEKAWVRKEHTPCAGCTFPVAVSDEGSNLVAFRLCHAPCRRGIQTILYSSLACGYAGCDSIPKRLISVTETIVPKVAKGHFEGV
jgi:hypothetical protein